MEKYLNEFTFQITSYTDLLFTSWTGYWDIIEIQYMYIQSYEDEKKESHGHLGLEPLHKCYHRGALPHHPGIPCPSPKGSLWVQSCSWAFNIQHQWILEPDWLGTFFITAKFCFVPSWSNLHRSYFSEGRAPTWMTASRCSPQKSQPTPNP